MSGSHHDILEIFDTPLDTKKEEQILSLVEILEHRKPKIIIDREFQKNLQKSLLQKKNSYMISLSFISDFPWYRIISGFSIICTSFIAIFSLYNIWQDSSIKIYPKKQDPEVSDMMMYSEEKAEMVQSLELNNAEQKTNTSHTRLSKMNAKSFLEEKSSLDTEISDIGNDILDLANTLGPLGGGSSASPTLMRAYTDETSPSGDATSAKISPENQGATSSMSPPNISEVLTKQSQNPIPEYPSTMKLYKKSTPWTPEEIYSRSGTGLEIRVVSTERNMIMFRRKVNTILKGKSIEQAVMLTYMPMRKKDDSLDTSYYLVPVLLYTLDTKEVISIPIIRGF